MNSHLSHINQYGRDGAFLGLSWDFKSSFHRTRDPMNPHIKWYEQYGDSWENMGAATQERWENPSIGLSQGIKRFPIGLGPMNSHLSHISQYGKDGAFPGLSWDFKSIFHRTIDPMNPHLTSIEAWEFMRVAHKTDRKTPPIGLR